MRSCNDKNNDHNNSGNGNILLTIAYDGSGFRGWQKQPGARTVQGCLEETLEKVCRRPVQLESTSRTDAGVHALGQRATLIGSVGIPAARIPVAVNNLLKDVVILDAKKTPEGFHARFSAVGKTYIYRYAISPPFPVFLRNYAGLLKEKLNTVNMSEAARHIEGTHDFASFQSAGGYRRETTVRTVYRVNISEDESTDPAGNRYGVVLIEVTGDGFLYKMVRIVANALAEVGSGKLAPGDIKEIIASCDRARAGPTAPAQGLYLKEVYFDKAALEAGTGGQAETGEPAEKLFGSVD